MNASRPRLLTNQFALAWLIYEFLITLGPEARLFWTKVTGASVVFLSVRYTTLAYVVLYLINTIYTTVSDEVLLLSSLSFGHELSWFRGEYTGFDRL